jgi:hypothetical protein
MGVVMFGPKEASVNYTHVVEHTQLPITMLKLMGQQQGAHLLSLAWAVHDQSWIFHPSVWAYKVQPCAY